MTQAMRNVFFAVLANHNSTSSSVFALQLQPQPESSIITAPASQGMRRGLLDDQIKTMPATPAAGSNLRNSFRGGLRRSVSGLRNSLEARRLSASSSSPKTAGDFTSMNGQFVVSPVKSDDEVKDSDCKYNSMKSESDARKSKCCKVQFCCRPSTENDRDSIGSATCEFEECDICYDDHKTCKLQCGHHVCKKCIETIIKSPPADRTCPYCRKRIEQVTDLKTEKVIASNTRGTKNTNELKEWTEDEGAACETVCVGLGCLACAPCVSAGCCLCGVTVCGNTMEGQHEKLMDKCGISYQCCSDKQFECYECLNPCFKKFQGCFEAAASCINGTAECAECSAECLTTCAGSCNEDHYPESCCAMTVGVPVACACAGACVGGYCGTAGYLGHCCFSGCCSAYPCTVPPHKDYYRLYKTAQLDRDAGERAIPEDVYKERDMNCYQTCVHCCKSLEEE